MNDSFLPSVLVDPRRIDDFGNGSVGNRFKPFEQLLKISLGFLVLDFEKEFDSIDLHNGYELMQRKELMGIISKLLRKHIRGVRQS